MPTIAIVEGVSIMVYPNDHPPPHIHAKFAEHRCKLVIANGEVLLGYLPPAKLQLVQRWLVEHLDDVSFAWEEVYSGRGFKGMIS